jgi:hypothetical protein
LLRFEILIAERRSSGNLNDDKSYLTCLMTAVASSSEIGKRMIEVLTVSVLDSVVECLKRILNQDDVLDWNVFIAARGIDETFFDLAEFVTRQFPIS